MAGKASAAAAAKILIFQCISFSFMVLREGERNPFGRVPALPPREGRRLRGFAEGVTRRRRASAADEASAE